MGELQKAIMDIIGDETLTASQVVDALALKPHRVEAGHYQVLVNGLVFEIKQLRETMSPRGGSLHWYISGKGDVASEIILARCQGPLMGGYRTLREALKQIPALAA